MNQTNLYPKEIWKNIPKFEKAYEVSNLGRIKSLKRKGRIKEKILKPTKDTKGYLFFRICYNNLQKMVKVHRMVAVAFIPNPNNLPQINHKNGNKEDNRVENLEWVTNKMNADHAAKLGLVNNRGINSGKARLTNEIVLNIRKLFETGKYNNAELAKMYGVAFTTVNAVLHRKTWKHI